MMTYEKHLSLINLNYSNKLTKALLKSINQKYKKKLELTRKFNPNHIFQTIIKPLIDLLSCS